MNKYKFIASGILTTLICLLGLFSQLHAQTTNPDVLDVGTVKNGVRHVDANEAAQILAHNADVKVLDVRTGWEYKRGHIKDAVNLNYYAFSFKKNLEKLDKKTIWLVHCKSGVRSGRTIPLMQEAGFENIIHMDGGFDDWRRSGLTID